MIRMYVGNDLDFTHPMDATMRMLRFGDKRLSKYHYQTFDLYNWIGVAYPASVHVLVDEVKQFFARSTDPRMSTGVRFFAVMDEDADHPLEYHTRPALDLSIDTCTVFRNFGQNADKDESIGLYFCLTRPATYAITGKSIAYIDNSLIRISNILWEFSPDGGAGKWYQLYDLPNRKYARVTLPSPTNRIRVRAISNNPSEWVQALSVTPKVDYQHDSSLSFAWQSNDAALAVDTFGHLSWHRALNGEGYPIYSIYRTDTDNITLLLGRTRNVYWDLEDKTLLDPKPAACTYHVVASDGGTATLTSGTVSY